MQKIVVWDVPTRLFHWLTVMLVAAAYAGYALLALVVFRLLCAERGRLPSLAAAPVSV